MTTGTNPPFQQMVLPSVHIQEFPKFYANQARVGLTLSDFTLIFGVSDDLGIGAVAAKDLVGVHLAPGTFKALLMHLNMMLEVYEEKIGTINISPGVSREVESQRSRMAEALEMQMNPPTSEKG